MGTNEWQEIKPGQAIPRGLHVSIDMQTGKKVAKLWVEEDKEIESPEDPHKALKEAMKKIKDDFKQSDNKDNKDTKTKFRSMGELKSELKDVDMDVKSDFLLMKELVGQFKESKTDSVKTELLDSLEYYVHQVDNALDFLQLAGLDEIVIPSLNSTTSSLRMTSCLLLGAAAQSNPGFQKAALEAGLISPLLRLVSLDPEMKVANKALYALSALLRNFPEAQTSFVKQGGLGVLTRLFEREGRDHTRLQIKTITLLHDLLVERQNTNHLARKLYKAVNIETQILEAGWCKLLNRVLVIPKSDRAARREDILSTMREDFPLRTEHDSIEKILEAMVMMLPVCSEEFSIDSELRGKLSFLGSQYSLLSDKERAEGEEDNFFSGIFNMIITVTSSLQKTEL